jgi:hypothetical protein
MRVLAALLLTLTVIGVFVVPGVLLARPDASLAAAAAPAAPNAMETAAMLPIIFRAPTLTPTPTPTASPTSIFSDCSGLEGDISLVENKPTYATYGEWVKFYTWIHNVTGHTACFGILGVNVVQPNGVPLNFNTQWSGQGAGGWLTLNPGCWGPNGIPCAPNVDWGRQEDHTGDGWPDHTDRELTMQGTHTIYYYACYSNFWACQEPGGDWHLLDQVSFNTIHWTPQAVSAAAAPTPGPRTGCYLVTNDPKGIYLDCSP